MAQGLFVGLPEEQILAIRDKALSFMLEGKTLLSYSDSGSSANKAFAMPPRDVLSEANYALSQLDPSRYGRRSPVVTTNWNNRIDF
jgi:hypothetical protein